VVDASDACVREAVEEMLGAIVELNGVRLEEVATAIFTLDTDLGGANPAAAARACGWTNVPLLMVREHGGDTRVPMCLRVLVLWNADRSQSDIRHPYLRGAARLRPDLTEPSTP
jgi:chorismate mutase